MKRPHPHSRRHNPTQHRAQATLHAIREACLQVLKQDGPEKLTTNRIAEVAGVSIGSLYQYYGDKHAIAADICNELLLGELGELDRLDQRTLATVRDSLDDMLRFFVEEHVARHRRLYQKLRDFYLEMHWRYDFEGYMKTNYPGKITTVDWLPKALKLHRSKLRVANLALASTMVMNAIEGTIHATLDRSPELIMKDEFCEELLALILGYLKLPATPAAN